MPSFSAAEPSSVQVKLDSGKIQGKAEGSIRVFLGIPYAAPPVGERRWKSPAPPAAWNEVRPATAFGAHCMQGPVYGDMTFQDGGNSEDCLSLNVWTPAHNRRDKLPVMVWIHGGGFVAGASSEPRQNGAKLAARGVVVVSMNYRLGIFGFLVNAELAKESEHGSAGNYGLLDQVAALQWVHRNIHAFGGDPGNVTIFGESAGSFSVSALMASPLAKGLFQKAIGESGAAFSSSSLAFDPLAKREEEDSSLLSSTLGPLTLAELRTVSARKLLDAFFQPGGEHNFAFGPDIDGYFLPQSVPAIFTAGKQNDVPLLAGWNRDEGSSTLASKKPAVASLRATAQKDFGENADEFMRLYPAENDAQAMRSMLDYAGDRFIAWSTWRWITAQTTTGKSPVYRYRFDLGLPGSLAYHSAEIEYVFGQLDSKANINWRPEDRQLSELMQKYWSNFARTGDPNGSDLPKWLPYGLDYGYQVMHLDAHSAAQKDDQRERYLFLTTQWEKQQ